MCGTALVGLRVARRRTPAQWTISDFAATPAERPAGDRLGAAWTSPLFTPLGVASLWVRKHLPDQAVETVHALLSELEGVYQRGTATSERACRANSAPRAEVRRRGGLRRPRHDCGNPADRRCATPPVLRPSGGRGSGDPHQAHPPPRRRVEAFRPAAPPAGSHLGSSCAPLDSRHVERGVEEEPRPVPRPCPPSPKRRAAPR
jgi:hypothetical protein